EIYENKVFSELLHTKAFDAAPMISGCRALNNFSSMSAHSTIECHSDREPGAGRGALPSVGSRKLLVTHSTTGTRQFLGMASEINDSEVSTLDHTWRLIEIREVISISRLGSSMKSSACTAFT